ncbi:MAG: hypothetical protein R3F41_07145 [Gammaproteobacteria bacterium]|nr:hypothetical protein [Pseudomonadales bacterium]MCP5348693.1 hypothetical protein [Pseudomonadales bacterium]
MNTYARSLSAGVMPLLVLCYTSPNLSAAEFTPRLNEYGQPDFQGNWTTETATPFQRPEELGDKKIYSEEEARQWEAGRIAELDAREAPIEGPIVSPEVTDLVTNSAEDQFKDRVFNVLRVNDEYRTSILVDPPNGRLPLRQDWDNNTFRGRFRQQGFNDFDGPEMAGPGERCLLDFGAVPPAVPIVPLSPNYQIVQNKDYVILYIEAGAELRIIRLADQHQTPVHKKWRGDSVGYYEGNSLVVKTGNLHPQSSSFVLPATELMQVEERFTLVSDSEIFYRFTIRDPNVYSQPFSGELAIRRMRDTDRIYDYTCHEGNYSLPGILAGARRLEVDADLTGL